MHQHKKHTFYHAVLLLYPKDHRREYGEQMVQTLDDLLSEHEDSSHRLGIWLRVLIELPSNLVVEHVNNLKGVGMNSVKSINKKVVATTVMGLIFIIAAVVFLLIRKEEYTPTTLSNVPQSAPLAACVQPKENLDISVKPDDETFIANAVASSIVDVLAGTNVDVYLSSYEGSAASGSAIYADNFGNYNFTAEKKTSNETNNYVGGWEISKIEKCNI